MPKVKAPLFGLEAHGTLDKTLTYSSSLAGPVAKTIPTHLPTYTPPQLKQRLLYKLGIAIWLGMDTAARAPYVAAAVGKPLTAMNSWLQTWLTTLPDLLMCLPMSNPEHAFLQNPASPANQPVLYGPSWTPLGNRYILNSDGVDDYAQVPNVNYLHLNINAYTILFKARFPGIFTTKTLLDKGYELANGWLIDADGSNRLCHRTRLAGDLRATRSIVNPHLPVDWYTWAITRSGANALIYRDTQDITAIPQAMLTPGTNGLPLTFFRDSITPLTWLSGQWAWFIVLAYAMTPAQIAFAHQALKDL